MSLKRSVCGQEASPSKLNSIEIYCCDLQCEGGQRELVNEVAMEHNLCN